MNSEFFDKPGFLYFLEVPCETWDILQYHEAWRKAQHPMNKAAVITAIKRQLGWFQTNGSRDEIIAARRLLKQLKSPYFRGSYGSRDRKHGGLRFRSCMDYGSVPLQLRLKQTTELRFRVAMDYGSAEIFP
ncbi:hypothetical protein BC936DRAFT_140722 [Jimgerdemannia flammicorona]|uniref:Uncharacterized protein n=1 Tax=Jimgerdemannia flammicorona TaxID=994334 RepID=A0A433AD54_9FUNG|nr:hypothetical protein BC936DRAFT_140722 [Jimgerdemannia flammicorona]